MHLAILIVLVVAVVAAIVFLARHLTRSRNAKIATEVRRQLENYATLASEKEQAPN